MDAFLVPLPATTSGSVPENKQFYFLLSQDCAACNISAMEIRQSMLRAAEIKDETPGGVPFNIDES